MRSPTGDTYALNSSRPNTDYVTRAVCKWGGSRCFKQNPALINICERFVICCFTFYKVVCYALLVRHRISHGNEKNAFIVHIIKVSVESVKMCKSFITKSKLITFLSIT